MSWLPVANSQGVTAALFSITPKYCDQTVGSKLSKPFSALVAPLFFTGRPLPLGSA
jgi:hypothetical protein